LNTASPTTTPSRTCSTRSIRYVTFQMA
jgi:hypothetical protein